MRPIRLVIADDHQLFLDGVVALLKDEPGLLIKATAEDGQQVLELIERNEFDVCLLDISMPRLDGIATARRIRERRPALKIIILTTYNDREIIDEMIKIGVAGYLLKNSTKSELIEGIQKVACGENHFMKLPENGMVQRYTSLSKGKESQVILTHRELEILRLLAKEYTNDRIAAELKISFRTVETHRKNMMQKTNAHNLAGLLAYAYTNRIIQ
jgi:DNA-binding NarL/FixJ family response regulator